MPIIHAGGRDLIITDNLLIEYLDDFIKQIIDANVKRILLLPPDHTRLYSKAGFITDYLYRILSKDCEIDIMPALGTHVPMNEKQLHMMFGNNIPTNVYLPHRWRDDLKELGIIPGSRLSELSEGKVDYEVQIAVNKILFDGNYDRIISIGQIVPHEVIGMANYTKNILIGIGGGDSIHKSHFLGAVAGMEGIMGQIDTPVRRILNEGFEKYLSHLPIYFMHTVLEKVGDEMLLRGFYAGQDETTFSEAAKLSQQCNINLLDKPIKKAVVYLDPKEFSSTWLGNKAIYRTRMAMADNGELIILAPKVETFGEDPEIDKLIREFGYKGTHRTLQSLKESSQLANNLSAAAHLIHGSSEGRFSITYCPGHLSQTEIESVGFQYAELDEILEKYPIQSFQDGFNTLENGEEIFYVSNPAAGLWAVKNKFYNS